MDPLKWVVATPAITIGIEYAGSRRTSARRRAGARPNRVGEPKAKPSAHSRSSSVASATNGTVAFVMLSPRVLAADHPLGSEFGDPPQAEPLPPDILSALDDGLGHLVDVAGRRVVDDGDPASGGIPLRQGIRRRSEPESQPVAAVRWSVREDMCATVIRVGRARISQWTVQVVSRRGARAATGRRTSR